MKTIRVYNNNDRYLFRLGQERGTDRSGECLVCWGFLTDADDVPPADDDAGWARLRHEHDTGCEWWMTRAGRVAPDAQAFGSYWGEAFRAAEINYDSREREDAVLRRVGG